MNVKPLRNLLSNLSHLEHYLKFGKKEMTSKQEGDWIKGVTEIMENMACGYAEQFNLQNSQAGRLEFLEEVIKSH